MDFGVDKTFELQKRATCNFKTNIPNTFWKRGNLLTYITPSVL